VCKPACKAGFGACTNPAAGCLTSLDTAAHCGACTTSCSGSTPFCLNKVCIPHLDIGVVNSDTIGNTSANGQTLVVSHMLQTSAAANAYRLVVVGVTGFGNGAASLPTNVQYNGVDMTLAKAVAPTNQVSAAIYFTQGADLPTNAGSYNVQLTSAGTDSFVLTANVLEFINVEQASSALDSVGGQANNNSCTVHPPSDSVNVSSDGEYIYSIASVYGQANDTNPNLSGQTITEQTSISSLGTVAGYLKTPPPGSRTISWAIGACSATAHALMSIKPAKTP
jgi:hypothetical protein